MTKNQPRYVPLHGPMPSEQEVEAKLHHEGYESFRWYDVPGASYPKHRHAYDECIWVLKGHLSITVNIKANLKDEDHFETYELKAGDRLYLPARTAHTASVPTDAGVTYLVGESKSPGLDD